MNKNKTNQVLSLQDGRKLGFAEYGFRQSIPSLSFWNHRYSARIHSASLKVLLNGSS